MTPHCFARARLDICSTTRGRPLRSGAGCGRTSGRTFGSSTRSPGSCWPVWWAGGAGPEDLTGPLTIDLDSSIVPVYGRGKQGAAFGYTKVRGYHPQFATCAETGMVLFSRLRGGAAGAARGAKSFLTETLSRVRDAGATGQLTVRADSAFYSRAVLGTAVKLGVDFSVTVREDKKIRAAIEAIDEGAWAPIPYWLSTPEVSGADVAETSYTAFSGKDA